MNVPTRTADIVSHGIRLAIGPLAIVVTGRTLAGYRGPMSDQSRTLDPHDRLRDLRRVRQYREFTPERLSEAEVDAIADVARWSGSSRNSQPWRFIVLTDLATIRRIADAGMPQTRSLPTATAAIAIVLPDEPEREVSRAYDEGRAAERILIAASMLGAGGGIAWIRSDVRDAVRSILGLPADRYVRTVVSLGHPSEGARAPKNAPGSARLPRSEVVLPERWPAT
jgi:nitroreductase